MTNLLQYCITEFDLTAKQQLVEKGAGEILVVFVPVA